MILKIKLSFTILLGTLLLVVASLFSTSALAHEGGPQLILQNNQLVPGEAVEVSGANLGTDLVVRIELAGNGTVIPLGEAVCDGHGDFTQTFVLPADLASGVYTLQVVDPSVSGAEVVLASTQVSIRAGWSQLLESNARVAVGLLALVAVVLGGGWLLQARKQSAGRILKQPDAPAR